MTRRRLFVAAAALAAVGLLLSVLLVRQHAAAHAGVASACNLSEAINCDRVATSPWSVVLGLPVAAWGVIGYGLILVLAVTGLRARDEEESWPAGLLLAFSAAAATASAVLAAISKFLIGALCLYCAGSWAAAFALLLVAWGACRSGGVAAAVRSDAGRLASRPGLTAGVAAATLALIAVAARAQPRYWEKAPPPPAAPAAPAPAGAPAAVVAPVIGPPVVVEFSDYECPFCAKAHAELRSLLADRPDVKVVKRHFPLDPSCNPLLKRPMHPDACALARAAICAEGQGRFEEMDEALFANQRERRPVEQIAREIGLDLPRFRACVADPETARRLSSDVALGIQIGLSATPTYVVNGVQYTGVLPAGALPPRR